MKIFRDFLLAEKKEEEKNAIPLVLPNKEPELSSTPRFKIHEGGLP